MIVLYFYGVVQVVQKLYSSLNYRAGHYLCSVTVVEYLKGERDYNEKMKTEVDLLRAKKK